MLDILKEMIIDFQRSSLPVGIPRRLNISTVPNKATVIVGVRRSGKSTYLFQIIQNLLDHGIPRDNILYINFFDDRLHRLQETGPAIIVDAYFSLYPEKKNKEKIYCFFDEIQQISGWESFVDRLMRTEKCEIYITGSSAQFLSGEVATQMRGRALSWEMFPFSFREFLDFKGLTVSQNIFSRERYFILNAFEEYRKTGGFPEVLDSEPNVRIKIHQEYLNAVLFRDLIERHDISHPRAVSDLAHRLIDNTASLYSVNALTGYLKSLGHKSPKSAVSDYLNWFEDAYFFFTVRVFDASLARSNTNPKKIYCIDHGLIQSASSGILTNSGHLLENMIFLVLRRKFNPVYYYKTADGREVDYIVRDNQGEIQLIQVCESLQNRETKNREILALQTAMNELNLHFGLIITLHDEEEIRTDAGTIKCIPAWKMSLE